LERVRAAYSYIQRALYELRENLLFITSHQSPCSLLVVVSARPIPSTILLPLRVACHPCQLLDCGRTVLRTGASAIRP
jgi:hypothetical protein